MTLAPRHQGQPGSIWVSWLYSRIGVFGSVDHVDMERREKKSGLRQHMALLGKQPLVKEESLYLGFSLDWKFYYYCRG